MEFKKGDWVISHYRVQMVLEVKNGKVREITDGSFCMGGNDITCFPLTPETKRWADYVNYHMDKIHGMPNNRALNFPDISRWMEAICDEGCQLILAGGKVNDLCTRVTEFYSKVEDLLEGQKKVKHGGVELFR